MVNWQANHLPLPLEGLRLNLNHPWFSGSTWSVYFMGRYWSSTGNESTRVVTGSATTLSQVGVPDCPAPAYGTNYASASLTQRVRLMPLPTERYALLTVEHGALLGRVQTQDGSTRTHVGNAYCYDGTLTLGDNTGISSSDRRTYTYTKGRTGSGLLLLPNATISVAPVVYVDGAKQTAVASSGTATTYGWGSDPWLMVGFNLAANAAAASYCLFASASTATGLADNVYADLSRDPLALFAWPERRIWVPVSAAGGSATNLVIADATHSHTADALTLTTTWLLTVQDALHAHAADAPTLSTQWLLTVADALHAHAADNLTLDTTGATNLVTADATHAHAADGLTLTTDSLLAVQEALHAHAADNVALSDAPVLLVADALHAHTADGVTMTVDAWLVVADATHGHLADNVVLFVPGGTTIREVLRLSSPLRRAVAGASTLARTVAGSSALTRTVALASDIDAESTTP